MLIFTHSYSLLFSERLAACQPLLYSNNKFKITIFIYFKKLKKKYWHTTKNNENNNRKRKYFWKNYFDLTFITLVKDKKYIGSNKDISIKYPCYRNDKIKESSQIVYLSMIENRLSTTLYPFKAFEESPTVCSLKNNQTSVKVCESKNLEVYF